MADVHIYKPSRTAMQAGQARTKQWVLEFVQPEKAYIEPLMKWMGSFEISRPACLFFETCEEAILYAKARNLSYVVDPIHPSLIKPKRYSDNFLPNKKR